MRTRFDTPSQWSNGDSAGTNRQGSRVWVLFGSRTLGVCCTCQSPPGSIKCLARAAEGTCARMSKNLQNVWHTLKSIAACRQLLAASHDNVRTEHGRMPPEHTRPRCTQICGKLAEKDSVSRSGHSIYTCDSTPSIGAAPKYRPCHTDKRSRIGFARWLSICTLVSRYRVGKGNTFCLTLECN